MVIVAYSPGPSSALADKSLAQRQVLADGALAPVGVAGQERKLRRFAAGVQDVKDGLLGADHGGQLGEDEPADRVKVLLALEHAAELGEVGLEPVLLGVFLRRIAQVSDHFVDVILQHRHFALRIHGDGTRQVALGHGGGHFGDSAHLRGKVCRQLVHVFGERFPRAGCAGHFRLSA